MSMFRRRRCEVPGLNMSSMPDLIFTVLFFFMIVTHMRSVPLKVAYQQPVGTELSKQARKPSVIYIYIGRPLGGQDTARTVIQVNDRMVDINGLAECIRSERRRMSPDEAQHVSASLKADRLTDMGTITDVKYALRQAGVYKVNYSAINR